MKIDNKASVQPVKLNFLTEKTVNKEDLTCLLCEDQFRDESFYVDFLADVHASIQNKMN